MNLNLLLAEPMDMPAPLGFDTWLTFWMVIVVSVVNGAMLCMAGYRFLQVLQLSNYRLSGFFTWIKEDKGKQWGRLLVLSFLSSAALLVTNVLLENFIVYKIMTYLGLVFYFLFVTIFVANQFNVPRKTPLQNTHRMNRLVGVLFLLIFLSTIFMLNFTTIYIPYFRYGAVGLTPVLIPVFILISYFITLPFEKIINRKFVMKAENKLSEYKDLIKIGITGSYAKTSVKNILSAMLQTKYAVCASPYSFNTLLGISKTINENLKQHHQVLICEMGARYKGDIAQICDLVKPQIGVLTGIGNQHLATFKTVEGLCETKFELAKAVGKNGAMFFNCDKENMLPLYDKFDGEKYASNINSKEGELYIEGLKVTANGSEFRLCSGKEKVECKTAMLGEHNVSNILLCAMVAKHLGLTLEEIASAIAKITPVSHRLALLPSANSLIVLDDAYNGSEDGSKAALKVLSAFDGKKFVITPGLVELGASQFNSNFEFGRNMAGVADYVIITGVINYDAISSGLIFAGFDEGKIYRAGSINQATEILTGIANAGDVVLFENDLPDNYA
ncbi:MAG: UDP-N-acetylmuramoyl-tripeptide--D-alanyl-D-alanine ligase [Clostridia bacterium]|nr:UDP-N-acetylmuramoyl-tripeptide--D-alanyl-D-alanine ligase [Clostridia bacterium]